MFPFRQDGTYHPSEEVPPAELEGDINTVRFPGRVYPEDHDALPSYPSYFPLPSPSNAKGAVFGDQPGPSLGKYRASVDTRSENGDLDFPRTTDGDARRTATASACLEIDRELLAILSLSTPALFRCQWPL